MEEPFAPRSLGKQTDVSLTGTVFPWDPSTDQPLLLNMALTNARYLVCFSSSDALKAMMERLEITGYTIKQIDDGPVFLSELPATYGGDPLHVILDPYFTPQNTIRFKQVVGAS